MSSNIFMAPKAPSPIWEELSANEKAWIEFIRVISAGRDPRVTPARIRALRDLIDTG